MSCAACEIKRATTLIRARSVMGEFVLDEVMTELNYRWPGSFFVQYCTATGTNTIMRRNQLPPYDPYTVWEVLPHEQQ